MYVVVDFGEQIEVCVVQFFEVCFEYVKEFVVGYVFMNVFLFCSNVFVLVDFIEIEEGVVFCYVFGEDVEDCLWIGGVFYIVCFWQCFDVVVGVDC